MRSRFVISLFVIGATLFGLTSGARAQFDCVDCGSEADQCGQEANEFLSGCIADCPPPIGIAGAIAWQVCAEICGIAFGVRNFICAAEYATCLAANELRCGPTPILIDLDRDNFHLSGLDDPVVFDIDADGIQDVVSWTSANTEDAFLCLDRNDNGLVDDGSELFGDATPLMDGESTSPNGYIALSEFDVPNVGGTGDRYIDLEDEAYPMLCVWIDENHNGLSEADELMSLSEAGVERISLSRAERGRRDQHGNEFRLMGDAWIEVNGHSKRTSTVDVTLVVQDGN